MNDIITTMFNKKFMEELFKPQELYSKKALRTVYDRLAHASIMRLNQASMDKVRQNLPISLSIKGNTNHCFFTKKYHCWVELEASLHVSWVWVCRIVRIWSKPRLIAEDLLHHHSPATSEGCDKMAETVRLAHVMEETHNGFGARCWVHFHYHIHSLFVPWRWPHST